jgi:large subunit ribosomal protein L24
MDRIRKGDTVVVTSGTNKGQRGKVLRILHKKNRVVIERVALVKRHTKPSQKNPQGGIVDKEGSIHVSNVQLWDDKLARGTRTKVVTDASSSTGKVRVGIKSGTKFPTAGM